MLSAPLSSAPEALLPPPASGISAYGLRQPERHPYPAGAPVPPVRLALQPVPAGLTYDVISFWEERLPGEVKRTTIEKRIRVAATARPGYLQVSYAADSPVLRKPDLSSYDHTLLLLAELYRHLELRVTPAGELTEVLNQAHIEQTWGQVKQELVRRSGGEDEFTQVLLEGMDEQLPQPGAVLTSLRLDYLFGFLLQNLYEQRFEHGLRYVQPRVFPFFFDGTDLWCRERLELVAPTRPGHVALRLTGVLDPARTDLAAVARQMAAAVQLAGPPDAPEPPVPAPEALRFSYEATCELDAATGWPVQVEASVCCWVPEGYSKEYFLRLEPEPTP